MPPSLPPGSAARWRPLVPVRVFGPAGQFRDYARALLDSGADDTVFPFDIAVRIGVVLQPATRHAVRWRGQSFPLLFGDVELELADESGVMYRWPATVGFTPAPIRYPLLGNAGCLCFFDTTFRGDDRLVELETNRAYPGATT
jgi:hypothetical protein